MKPIWRMLLISSLLLAFIMSEIQLHEAQAATKTTVTKTTATKTVVTNPTVKLSAKSTIAIKDAQTLIQDSGKIVAFTLTIANNEAKSLDLLDYWVRLKSKSGKTFSITLVDKDKNIKKIAANTTTNLTYYAELDDQTEVKDLRFEIIKWDFSSAGYEKKLGTLQPATNYSVAAKPYDAKTMLYDKNNIKSSIKDITVSEDDDYSYLNISFVIENAGSKSTNVGKLKFNIQKDSEKLVYDVDAGDLTKVTLQPKEKKTITINATLPKQKSLKGLNLTLSTANESNNILLPIGSFEIPTKTIAPDTASVGKQFKYGNFGVKLTNIQRSTLHDYDVILADVQVTNTSTAAAEVPNLSGYFTVNGVRLNLETTFAKKLDQVIMLEPNQSYTYVVYTDIPYTTDINQIVFTVTEQDKSQTTTQAGKTLFQYKDTKTSSIPEIAKETKYQVDNIGQKSEVQLIRSDIYSDVKNDLIYTELVYENKEARSSVLNNIGGFVQSKGRESIPIDFSAFNEKVFPDGKILVSGYAKVPKNYLTDDVDLIIGQSITKTEGTSSTNVALVKAVSIPILQNGQYGTIQGLSEIPYLNYLMNINTIYTTLHGKPSEYIFDGLNITFYYDLYNLTSYANGFDDHKLWIEFVDSENDNVKYSKEITFDVNKQDTAAYLKEGENIAKTITFLDNDIITKLSQRKYHINIYHEYKNNKFLIATKELIW